MMQNIKKKKENIEKECNKERPYVWKKKNKRMEHIRNNNLCMFSI